MTIIKINESTPFATWLKFRLLHPFNRESYNQTPENMARWKYHILATEKVPALKVIKVDNNVLILLRGEYRVTRFQDFPQETKWVYEAIARRFPGSQVYACGSRVRGDYVDSVKDAGMIDARLRAGMKARYLSDYDFWVEPGAQQVGDLPENTDRCRLRIPENEKVQIPIYEP